MRMSPSISSVFCCFAKSSNAMPAITSFFCYFDARARVLFRIYVNVVYKHA